MTTELPGASSAPSLPELLAAGPLDTPLLMALANREKFASVTRAVFAVGRRRGIPGTEIEEIMSETFVVAVRDERTGKPWDPAKKTAEWHVVGLLTDEVLANRRRAWRRKPPPGPLPEGYDPASSAPSVEDELAARQEEDLQAAEVRKALAAQTRSGLTLRVIDARVRGIENHDDLAKELECSRDDVRAAFKRIKRKVRQVAEAWASKKRAS